MITTEKKIGFVAWMNNCRRSEVLSYHLGANTLFLPKSATKTRMEKITIVPIYYVINSLRTIVWLLFKRPDVVFSQAPPVFCPLSCLLFTVLYRKKLVIDCHNAFFDNFWPRLPGFRWLLKKANIVICHNNEYVEHQDEIYQTNNFFSLEDKLLENENKDVSSMSMENQKPYFFIVVSFSSDEPIKEMLIAATIFLKNNPGFEFKITGNFKKKYKLFEKYSNVDGIVFLGFVDDNLYLKYLKHALAIVALSKRDMIQQCASVEALSFEVPMILPDTKTSKRLFQDAVVYTEPYPENIIAAYEKIVNEKDMYRGKLSEQKIKWEMMWNNKFQILKQKIIGDNL